MNAPLPPARSRLRTDWLLPACVFLILSGCTLAFWHKERTSLAEARQLDFERAAAQVTSELRDRLKMHAQFLRTLGAYFSARSEVPPAEWEVFATRMSSQPSLPGVLLFGFAPAVDKTALPAFEARMRHALDRSYAVFPPPRGRRAVPVLYAAPDGETARRALGFDIASEDMRRQALDMAAERDDVTLSGRIVLVMDRATQTPGLLMLRAIYRPGMPLDNVAERRAAFAGVVYAAYRIGGLMDSLGSALRHDLRLQVLDATPETAGLEAQPLHDSHPDGREAAAVLRSQHELDFGHRTWLLSFERSLTQDASDSPTLVLFSGLAISTLLSLLIGFLSTHQQRLEEYARRVTAELHAHRDRLQELVADRTAELQQALQEARAAHMAKSEFLANMSHELRTPMHAILSFSGLGMERSAQPGGERLHRYFERIRQSAGRLLDLINNLLDLSRLEAGRMETSFTACDVAAIAGQVVAELESLLPARGLRVAIENAEGCLPVHGDARQIERVLHNLVANAIRFSPAGGTIAIRLAPDQLPAGRRATDAGQLPALSVTVSDQGVGIPPEELESIFDKFVQSSKTRTGAGGTGLGLAICREIVHAHRGTIVAHNNPAGGASFVVRLPLDPPKGIGTDRERSD